MPEFTVTIVRHIVSYLSATTVVEATDLYAAAAQADQMDLEWLEVDGTDESFVDYMVVSPGIRPECWRTGPTPDQQQRTLPGFDDWPYQPAP